MHNKPELSYLSTLIASFKAKYQLSHAKPYRSNVFAREYYITASMSANRVSVASELFLSDWSRKASFVACETLLHTHCYTHTHTHTATHTHTHTLLHTYTYTHLHRYAIYFSVGKLVLWLPCSENQQVVSVLSHRQLVPLRRRPQIVGNSKPSPGILIDCQRRHNVQK